MKIVLILSVLLNPLSTFVVMSKKFCHLKCFGSAILCHPQLLISGYKPEFTEVTAHTQTSVQTYKPRQQVIAPGESLLKHRDCDWKANPLW